MGPILRPTVKRPRNVRAHGAQVKNGQGSLVGDLLSSRLDRQPATTCEDRVSGTKR